MDYGRYFNLGSPDMAQYRKDGSCLHPENVVTNKNGGRYDSERGRPARFNVLGNMNKHRTDSRYRQKLLYVPPVYTVLPAKKFSSPRLVKKVK